jgi:hypothetical protein
MTMDHESMEKIIAITYNIWYARNQSVFQDKQIPQEEVSSKAQSQLIEYQRHGIIPTKAQHLTPTVSSSNNNRWIPPLRDALKINVDAHLSSILTLCGNRKFYRKSFNYNNSQTFE